jgi:hypothetical protein
MLTKTSFRIKKLRSFCTKTNSNDHPLIFKENELNISTKDNRALLREIIEQNKENNELLRTIIKQNYLQSYHNNLIHTKPNRYFEDRIYSIFHTDQTRAARNKHDKWFEAIPLEELMPLAHSWQLPLIKYMQETDTFIESLKKE